MNPILPPQEPLHASGSDSFSLFTNVDAKIAEANGGKHQQLAEVKKKRRAFNARSITVCVVIVLLASGAAFGLVSYLPKNNGSNSVGMANGYIASGDKMYDPKYDTNNDKMIDGEEAKRAQEKVARGEEAAGTIVDNKQVSATQETATNSAQASTTEQTTPTPTPSPAPAPPVQPSGQVTTFPIQEATNATTHDAFPAGVKLVDGRIMIVYRGAANHYPTISVGCLYKTYSSDGGNTWTKAEKIPLTTVGSATTLTARNVSDPGLLVPKTGPLAGKPVLTYFETMSGVTASRVVAAKDTGGEAWGIPAEVKFVDGWVTHLVSSPAVQLNDATFIVAGYGRAVANEPMSVASSVFSYNATTGVWTRQYTTLIASGGGINTETRTFSEPNIVKLSDGRLMVLIRTNSWGATALSIRKAFSSDSGKSWSTQSFAFTGEGNPHIILASNGVLYSSYRHWDGSQTGTVDGQHWAVYRTSSNFGGNWSAEVRYGDNPARWMSYAALIEYEPGKVLSVWSKEDSETTAVLQVEKF